jgi:hypothetical protein
MTTWYLLGQLDVQQPPARGLNVDLAQIVLAMCCHSFRQQKKGQLEQHQHDHIRMCLKSQLCA